MRTVVIIVVAILAAGCDVRPKDDGARDLKRPNNPVLDATIIRTGGKG